MLQINPPVGQVDFLAETDHFIHALKEGLKSLVGGLELRGMDSETRESSECLDTRNFTQVLVLVFRWWLLLLSLVVAVAAAPNQHLHLTFISQMHVWAEKYRDRGIAQKVRPKQKRHVACDVDTFSR